MRQHYIPYSEVESCVPTTVGEQVNVNHKNCPAGVDTKRRLYVTLKQGGAVVWYCHHCNGSGSRKLGTASSRRSLHKSVCDLGVEHNERTKAHRTIAKLGGQVTQRVEEVSQEGLDWIHSGGVTNNEVIDYGFGYSKDVEWARSLRDRVVLPCYGSDGLAVVQYRKLSSTYDPRKYITYGTGVFDTQYRHRRVASYDSRTIVVVEDILSAVRVGRYCRCIAALHGTVPVSYLCAANASGDYDRVVVWLDNDNLTIRRAAREAARELSVVYPSVLLVSGTDDPKHHTDQQIQEILNGNTV